MPKIYKDGITQDSVTGQIYQVGRSADAVDYVEPTPTPTPTTPTIGDIVGQYETPEEQAYRQQYGEQLRAESQTTPDLNKIRQDTLARYQAEIDAINSSYATKKAAERIQGQGRLGSAGAIQARRGLLGSDFGAAQTDTTNQYNAELVDAIEQERLAKVSSIMSEANRYSQEEYDKKLEAKRLGADNYLKFIGESATRRQDNTAKMAAYLYQQGNYDTLSPAELKQIADNLGISVDTLKAVYTDYAGQAQAAQAKAQTEAEKEALGMEKTRAEIANTKGATEKDMIAKGYTYVNTPAKRDELIKQGYSMTTIGGRTYSKPPTTKTVQIGKTDYLVTYDEAGNPISQKALGSTGGGSGTGGGTSTKFNESEAKGYVEQYFYQESGGEKQVSPDAYYAARAAWVEEGGTAERFDALYYKKLYTNPALDR